MAKRNAFMWDEGRRPMHYDPILQFFLRMIRVAYFDAMTAGRDGVTDRAIMARDWIARATPDRHGDSEGYFLSFEHCCEVLGLSADYEATWMLEKIDAAADFDTDEVYERISYLTANPPDEVEEELFEGFRCVPALDQGSLFSMMEA